ncbi:MAG: DVU0298 family protein [Dissulfuribacterales bacterium]
MTRHIHKTQAFAPRCPFCDRLIDRPKDFEPKRFGDFETGFCPCGAVYLHDVTGHNLGAAIIEAMGVATDDDWEMAWNLMPGEDYTDHFIADYDIKTHLIHPTGRTPDGKRVRGTLTFVRLADDIQEAVKSRPEKRLRIIERPAEKDTEQPRIRRRFSRQEVTRLVQYLDIPSLQLMATQDSLALRNVQRLLCSAETTLRWHAVLSIGILTKEIAKTRPNVVGDFIRTLLFITSDSAQASWGSIESIGEIIRNNPKLFGTFVQHILGFIASDPGHIPAVLWAIGRIGALHPQLVRASSFFVIFDLLSHTDSIIRGHAVWALGCMRAKEAKRAIESLQEDMAEIQLFDGEKINYITVGMLAKQAAQRLKDTTTNLHCERKEAMEPEELQNNPEIQEAKKTFQEGLMCYSRGMSLDAIKHFEKALKVFETYKLDVDIANTCEKLGDLHLQRGNLKPAIPLYQRAMAICEKYNDPISEVLLCEKIIDIYKTQNAKQKAYPYLIQALELVEKLGDSGKAAFYLTGIGDIFEERGEVEKALDAYEIAHKIYKGMGSRGRAEVLENGIRQLKARMAGAA